MMKRLALLVCLVLTGTALFAAPAHAYGHARVSVGIGLGGYPYYSPYYYGYPYYAPPVVYAAPPAVVYQDTPPTVVYQDVQQPPPSYAPQAQQPAPPPQQGSSPTYKDTQGRTCRNFTSLVDGDPVSGKACLGGDGTWHTVAQ